MKSQWVFCSACDRMVRALVTEASSESGQAGLEDAEIVCLEIGVACTGNMCPLGGGKPGATRETHTPRESPDGGIPG